MMSMPQPSSCSTVSLVRRISGRRPRHLLSLLLLAGAWAGQGCRSTPPSVPPPLLEQEARQAEDLARHYAAHEQQAAAAMRWQQAAEKRALLNQPADEAVALHNLGLAQRSLGQNQAARTQLERAAQLNRHLGLDQAWWRNQIALCQLELVMDEGPSLSNRLHVLQSTASPTGDPEIRAALANELGQWELREGRLEAALGYFAEAETTFSRAGRPAGHATAMANQARVLERLQRPEEALPLWENALRLFEAEGHAPGIATSLAGQGRTLLALRRHTSQAEFVLRQALANFQALNMREAAEATARVLAELLSQQGRAPDSAPDSGESGDRAR